MLTQIMEQSYNLIFLLCQIVRIQKDLSFIFSRSVTIIIVFIGWIASYVLNVSHQGSAGSYWRILLYSSVKHSSSRKLFNFAKKCAMALGFVKLIIAGSLSL